MKLEPNHIYSIKDKFFEDFPDPSLKHNKDSGRPHYYAFDSRGNEEISWVIPMSSRTEKYEKIIDNKEKAGKPSDIIHVCTVGSRKQAFLIQDMFPVTKDYVQDNYRINNIPYKVVSKKDAEALDKKANRIKTLIDRGIKYIPNQVDVKSIEKELVEKMRKERERKRRILELKKGRDVQK